ncbi:MAG TPA: TonB-dependent receptor [Bacteroidales bacterium]|nr:TonB-dependent receptor [Bacteroidales bacterium]
MKRKIISSLSVIFALIPFMIHAQQGSVKGRIFDESNNEPIAFANIIVFGTTIGSTSDLDGNFIFTGLEPGFIKLAASAVGYESKVTIDFQVTNSKTSFMDIPMKPKEFELQEVVIKASPFKRLEESPVSLRTLQISEIEKNPGGNRDISRVIQVLPGVSSTPAFRNDVLVRGGGGNENAFYLDGIEIPNLNHFSTQGSSGGPVGIINADFIREVDFYSGAFPADRGKSLSSLLDMKLIDGNKEEWIFRGSLGASDLALTTNGPVSDNFTFLFSYRRSYLQFLFDALGLPFLPNYDDFLAKYKIQFDQKNELSVIGLGSIDRFELNTGIKDPDESQAYILGYLPVQEQWSYTIGAVYKHYHKNGFTDVILSRNMLDNRSFKYRNNDENDTLNFNYNSQESENKLRVEHTSRRGAFKYTYGGGLELARYTNSTFQRLYANDVYTPVNYDSQLRMFLWNVFGQVSKNFFDDRLVLSLGLRMDANDYTPYMANLLNQVSPRFSASFGLTDIWFLNFNTGRYYQRLPYTTFGFRDNNGELVNKRDDLRNLSADHVVFGFEVLPERDAKFSIEGFYKYYRNYPFSVRDSINIASKSAGYGTFGDEQVISVSDGRAYGFEVLAQDKSLFGFNVILSYTFVVSKFTDKDDKFVPSAWDNRNILNLTVLKSFKRNWDIGAKWRYVGGAPYTPADLEFSSYVPAWDARGREYPDNSRFNELRLKAFHQLDLRVDKTYFFKKWSLNLYIDVQNVYNFQAENPPNYTNLDKDGNKVYQDPPTNQFYQLRALNSESGTVLPTLGIIVEF